MSGTTLLALAVATVLSACLPVSDLVEIGSRIDRSVDTEAIAEAVTATSETISSTIVETSVDGFNTRLYVRPVITTEGFTAIELNAVLEVAYLKSVGDVEAIEVRTVDASDEPVDIFEAATELGIHYVDNVNSVTYSTVYLDEAYGK